MEPVPTSRSSDGARIDAEPSSGPGGAGPSVTVTRRVEWPDTDAAGHYHHSTVVRWVEAAEAELLRNLGLSHLFGSTPRVRFEADYEARLWFGQLVTVELRVERLGRSSLHYAFRVADEAGGRAAAGRMVVVHSAARATSSVPWPDDVRAALTTGDPTPSP
ncbi:thioesterase family protein [Nocardiopsis sp. NPDC049922]|uniref:acyl-CoA thioesterase n=1 Tax=Nocardiopsis sp. NPDC049922 TaxID=3155157 RepID=UPI0033F7EBA1